MGVEPLEQHDRGRQHEHPSVVLRADQADHADHRPPAEKQSGDVARRREPPDPQRRRAEPRDPDEIAEAEADPGAAPAEDVDPQRDRRSARAATIPTAAGRNRGRAPRRSPRGPGSTLSARAASFHPIGDRPTSRPETGSGQAHSSNSAAGGAAALADACGNADAAQRRTSEADPGRVGPQCRLDAFDAIEVTHLVLGEPVAEPREPHRHRVTGDAGVGVATRRAVRRRAPRHRARSARSSPA